MDASTAESGKDAKTVVFRGKILALRRLAFTARQNGIVEYAPPKFFVNMNAKSTLAYNVEGVVFAVIIR
jgi:hypothetical protein